MLATAGASAATNAGVDSTGSLESPARPEHFDHAPFDLVLRDCVRDCGVDYAALKERHAADLTRYLQSFDDPKLWPRDWPREEAMAFWINLYNATVLQAVLERVRPGFRPNENDRRLFREPRVRVAQRRISLDDLEQQVIRGLYHDPRVMAALVAGAKSSPPLKPTAWRAHSFDADLDTAFCAFVGDPRQNLLDEKARTLRLSRLFESYATEFRGQADRDSALARCLGHSLAGYSVSFREFSWELNAAPSP
jgi:hypothetical protein